MSFIGHCPPHGYPLHIYQTSLHASTSSSPSPPYLHIMDNQWEWLVAWCIIWKWSDCVLSVTHLPPVSNPTSEGPEVWESSPPSVREYGTVGAAATEAVTHGEHDTQLEGAH